MLPAIDSIPWSKLYSFMENAECVPDCITKLKGSLTESEVSSIYKTLEQELHYPDEICQATAFATPYLLELLNKPNTIVTPKVLKLLQLFFRKAIFGASEVGFRVSEDTLENPEQYRGDAASLGDGTFSGSTPRDEINGWCVLVYMDLKGARDKIEALASSSEPEIKEPAKQLLRYVDDYWSEEQKHHDSNVIDDDAKERMDKLTLQASYFFDADVDELCDVEEDE